VLHGIPLNSEPEGASSTLRLAKLSFFAKPSEEWDVRFNVNYNNAGHFELGNNYANYTG